MTVDKLYHALINSDQHAASVLFDDYLNKNSDFSFIEQLVVPVLSRIGDEWSKGKLSLSQVYISGRIVDTLTKQMIPESRETREDQPVIALVVLQDYHVLGKRIIQSVLRASGYRVLDYGTMRADDLAKRAMEDEVDILLISTLMISSAQKVRRVREVFDKNGATIKIIVGGAPFNFDENLWKRVGADGMGSSTAELLALLDRWENSGS